MKLLRLNSLIILIALFLFRLLLNDTSLVASNNRQFEKNIPAHKVIELNHLKANESRISEISNPPQDQEPVFEIYETDTDNDDDDVVKGYNFLFAYLFSFANNRSQQQNENTLYRVKSSYFTATAPHVLFRVFRI